MDNPPAIEAQALNIYDNDEDDNIYLEDEEEEIDELTQYFEERRSNKTVSSLSL